MTYADLVARIEALAVTRLAEDASFAAVLPGLIEAAEFRCLRDCDFPSARKTASLTLAVGVASVAVPADLVVPRAAWLVTGAGPSVRSEVQRRDASYLREFWPDAAAVGLPRYFATTDAAAMLLAPTPGGAYRLDLDYTFRPAGLSAGNPSTWLSERYPDLLLYGVMVLVAGYQRNFGAQTDDPQMPGSWERQYQQALLVARNEAATGKGWGAFDRTPAPPPPGLSPRG